MMPKYIPDLVADVVARTSEAVLSAQGFEVYYDFGNHFDVVKNLTEKDGNPQRPGKFPLVWLVTPFVERHARQDMYAEVDLRLIIANDTDANYYMFERRDKVFLPVLYPVLAELLKQFTKSAAFQVAPLVYEKTDLQLARVDSTGKLIFNDYADIIDLTLFKVLIKQHC